MQNTRGNVDKPEGVARGFITHSRVPLICKASVVQEQLQSAKHTYNVLCIVSETAINLMH